MTKRDIIFHVGHPKTGSSALQAFLSENAEELRKRGVGYPFPEGKNTISSGYCSGNVWHTMLSMARSEKDRLLGSSLKPKGIFENYFSKAINLGLETSSMATVLFSAEAITTVPSAVSPVFRQLNREHNVRLVCFVRDPYDFAISSWKQMVKVGKLAEEFEPFTKSRIAKQYLGVESVLSYLPAVSDVKLINFDIHRKDIFTPFLRAIGIDDDLSKFRALPKSESNPSLSYSQAAALVHARKTVRSPLYHALLTRRFRNQKENVREPYFREVDEQIMDFLKDDLQALNQMLPEGERLRDTMRREHEVSTRNLSVEILKSVLETINETSQLSAKRPKLPANKNLPADFDPIVYLLLNPDLEAAGVEPVQHYVTNGRFEGRKYK